ncbi:unnamed protein product, partial [Sphacelaria rigidula]
RDGNPNVTPEVTRQVSFTARWQAAVLMLRDVLQLQMELSTTKCSPELREIAGGAREPYREVLKPLEMGLKDTIEMIMASQQKEMKDGERPYDVDALPINSMRQVVEPLMLMHRSLIASGQKSLANGSLVDMIRRVRCFGVCLAPLDVRQESTRHTEALDAITRHLGVGSYAQWDEATKQSWLLTELHGKRPLLPKGDSLGRLGFDETVQDTLRTFEMTAQLGQEALGAYVISMAKAPSDVLAVKLLQVLHS